jgi:DNA-binding PadR family transcriptional regulator
MHDKGFSRQWARHFDEPWRQHHGGGWGGSWGGTWGDAPWGRGRPGPPPWLSGLFGLAQQGPPQRGPRVRRGDVRSAILDMLRQEPMNGYQIITQIAERTQGAWKPSPGSVYPTISQLEDEGLIAGVEGGGQRKLQLTDAGNAYVEERRDELAAVWAPFEQDSGRTGDADAGEDRGEGKADYANLKPEIGQVMNAVWQIVTTGTDQQKREAIEVLVETRRKLYGLLADGDSE